MSEALDITTSPVIGNISHGFLGRSGGASTGIYAGLNVGIGSDDDADAVTQNRRSVVETIMPEAQLITVYQVHSADAVIVTEPLKERPEADAMVTDQPGLMLGILTADCVPVLFHDARAGVIGAAHAGWKGAIGGVTDNTIAAMEKIGAKRENIACAIGPCIAQDSYEVDAAFYARFVDADAANTKFFAEGKPQHLQFDIENYVAERLARIGILQIDKAGLDTYANEHRFYSYRRSCHRGEAGYGRQISVIALNR